MGNDISNEATPLVWVLEDVVFQREEVLATDQSRSWIPWRKKQTTKVVTSVVVDRAGANELWLYQKRFSGTGLKIEMVHFGDPGLEEAMMSLIEATAASGVSSVVTFPTEEDLIAELAYRPDVIGVVTRPGDSARYGSRGMSFMDLR